jgi:CheY-like chemotaxis protein
LVRPCFLILDNDFPGSISSRKLVIESAKLNVITTYSTAEAIETLERYPNVDGVVIDVQLNGHLTCRQVIEKLREIHSSIPIITVSASGHDPCDGEQHHVSSYDPRQLLTVLEKVRPDCAAAIEHDNENSRKRFLEKENRSRE